MECIDARKLKVHSRVVNSVKHIHTVIILIGQIDLTLYELVYHNILDLIGMETSVKDENIAVKNRYQANANCR